MARLTPRLIIGAALASVGLVLLLDNLGYIYAEDYLRYWPIALILVGIAKLREPQGRFFGYMLVIGGGWLMLDRLDLIRGDLWDYWPILIIALGLWLVIQAILSPSGKSLAPATNEQVRRSAILNTVRLSSSSKQFQSAELSSILATVVLDLREAEPLGGEAVVDCFAVMASIELIVGDRWRVELEGSPILGEFEEKRKPAPAAANLLRVKGTVIMASVEIKNEP